MRETTFYEKNFSLLKMAELVKINPIVVNGARDTFSQFRVSSEVFLRRVDSHKSYSEGGSKRYLLRQLLNAF